jgi:hypothetical protein
LKLRHDEPLSNVAFSFDLRRYAQADGRPDDVARAIAGAGGTGVGGKEAAEAAAKGARGGLVDKSGSGEA